MSITLTVSEEIGDQNCTNIEKGVSQSRARTSDYRNENMTSTDVVLAGRLATSVKKQFILAIPSGREKIDYVALDWWKA